MRFAFFKSVSLAAVVALQANATYDIVDDVYDGLVYELAQIDNEPANFDQQSAKLSQTKAKSHSHGHSHSHSNSDLHSHSHSHSHSHADADLELDSGSESDSDIELDSDSESDAEDLDLAQVDDFNFNNMLAQIEAKIDEQEREHQTLLAEVAEYLSTLQSGDIDAMESYLAQLGAADGSDDSE